jgi:PKHD-type hydroxylase
MITSTYIFDPEMTNSTNYYYYPTGLSNEDIDKVYKGVGDVKSQQATTANNDKSFRSSYVKWLPKNDEWEWLYRKVMYFALDANKNVWNFNLHSVIDQIQYTEYYASEGGHYGWHQDIGPNELSLRKVSITVQLTGPDEYEGGDLEYWQGGEPSQAPKGKGLAFVFPSYMMHRVTKVTKGIRRSLVLWVGGEHYK